MILGVPDIINDLPSDVQTGVQTFKEIINKKAIDVDKSSSATK
jgi:hypothetical protein